MMKGRLLVAALLLVACSMGCSGTGRNMGLPHGAREDVGEGRATHHDSLILRDVLAHGPTIEALVRSTVTTVLVATGWMYQVIHGKAPGVSGAGRRAVGQVRQREDQSTLRRLVLSNSATTEIARKHNSTSTARQTSETEVSTSQSARAGWEYENELPEFNPNSWSVFGRMVSPQASPAPPQKEQQEADDPPVQEMPAIQEMPAKASAANLNMWSSFGRRSASDRLAPERTRDGNPVRSSSVNPGFFLTPFGDQTDKQRSIEARQVKPAGEGSSNAAAHKRTPNPNVHIPSARPTLQPDWTKIPFFG